MIKKYSHYGTETKKDDLKEKKIRLIENLYVEIYFFCRSNENTNGQNIYFKLR